jgi:hypothetical protein
LGLAYLATQQTAPRSLLETAPASQSVAPPAEETPPAADSTLPSLPPEETPAQPANENN